MKLSELIKNLVEAHNSFRNDPDVFIQTPNMEEVEIFDFIQRCSSEREGLYFVINTCDEEAYYEKQAKEWEEEWNKTPKYKKVWYQLSDKLENQWIDFQYNIYQWCYDFKQWCKRIKSNHVEQKSKECNKS